MATTLAANIRIRAIDQFSRVTSRLRLDMQRVTAAQEKASKSFALAAQMNQAAQAVGQFARVARTAVAAPIKSMVDFEQSMANVRAVTSGITENEFTKLEEKAKFLGSSTKFSAVEAAEGLRFLAIAGFDAEKQMSSIGPVLQLAGAASTDLGTASDIASDLLGAFRLEASDMGDVANVLTATFTRSNTTLESLFETMKLVGPEATDMGVSMREVAGMTAVLGSAGIKGSLAGTALRQMFKKMINPSKAARKEMSKMGLTIADDLGNLRKPTEIFKDLIESTKDMGNVARGKALSTLFGTRASTAISNLLAKMKGDELTKFIDGLKDVSGETKRIQDITQNTAKGAMVSFQSAVEGLKIELGQTFGKEFKGAIKAVTGFVRGITRWMKAHPELTKALFASAVAFAVFLTALQGVLVIIATGLAAKGVLFLAGGFTGLAASIGAAALAAAPFIIAIAAIGTAAYFLITRWGTVSAFFQVMWNKFTNLSAGAKASVLAFVSAIPIIGPMIVVAIAAVDLFKNHWDNVVAAFDTGFNKIKEVFNWVADSPVFKAITGSKAFKLLVSAPLATVKSIGGAVDSAVSSGTSAVGSTIERISDEVSLVEGGASASLAEAQVADRDARDSRIAGKIQVSIDSEGNAKVKSIESTGPIELEADAGMSMMSSGG